LLRDDPWLPFDILGIPRPVDGTPTPTRAEIERDGQEPLTVQQDYPDLVLLYRTPVWLDEPAPRPTAAVLAGALHGYAGDFEAARIAFRITRTMDKKSRRRHGMTILAALPKDQRERLIGELPVQEQHSWMDVERRSGTYHFGVEEGLAQGREHERATLIALIFKLLGQRDVIVDAEAEGQIRGCDDLSTLQQWVLRAAHATSTAELLAP
jgi:hypothetical protein